VQNIDFHIVVVQMKENIETIMSKAPCMSFSDACLEVFLSKADDLTNMKASFYTEMRAVGAKVTTPATKDFKEALRHRESLLDARDKSLAAFKYEYRQILASCRLDARGRGWYRSFSSEDEVADFVEDLFERAKKKRDAREQYLQKLKEQRLQKECEKEAYMKERQTCLFVRLQELWKITVNRAQSLLNLEYRRLKLVQLRVVAITKRQAIKDEKRFNLKRRNDAQTQSAKRRLCKTSALRHLTFAEQQAHGARLRTSL